MSTFEELKGKIISEISYAAPGSLEIVFTLNTGETYKMYHSQDCCESVSVEDICGDISDIVGSEILLAEEATSGENPEGISKEDEDSFTWTFYKLSTIKGSVTIRWYGSSNGYYSEEVSFIKIGGE